MLELPTKIWGNNARDLYHNLGLSHTQITDKLFNVTQLTRFTFSKLNYTQLWQVDHLVVNKIIMFCRLISDTGLCAIL